MLFAISAQALETSISYSTFNSPKTPYIEVYVHVIGSTVKYIPIDSSFSKAKVEVLILIKKGEEIIKAEKYQLNSPLATFPKDFMDLKRFALENGDYHLEVSVTDANQPDQVNNFDTPIKINFDSDLLVQSDIQLLASFKKDESASQMVKNGYFLENLPFNFYHKNLSKLIFYHEIYNSNKVMELPYLVRYYIEEVDGSGEVKTVMMGHKAQKPKNINIMLVQMDITKLKSGNYNLVVEVRNPDELMLSKKKVFFQRSNPYLELEKIQEAPPEEMFTIKLSQEELRYSLRAIAMNVPESDVEIINLLLKNDEAEAQRSYLFSYWALVSPVNPEATYKKYMEVAKAVDKTYYAGFGPGFESDRGWVFMKYGKPDEVVTIVDEVAAPPYEIWSYHKVELTRQPNGKFLFFNPSLASGNFQLLHSNVRGEVNNPDWEQQLYQDGIQGEGPNGGNLDAISTNRNARAYFTDF